VADFLGQFMGHEALDTYVRPRASFKGAVKNVSRDGQGDLGVMREDAGPKLPRTLELRLFGCWHLSAPAGVVDLGGREQRLVALLALRGRKPRSQIAGTLWPDTTDERALTSLRSAVLRVRRSASGLLELSHSTLALAPDVRIDVQEVVRWAAETAGQPTGHERWWVNVLRGADLLPGWYEDWVVFERERLQLLRFAALESVALHALEGGDHDTALTAALEAVAIEPLRESAHSLVIRAHLVAGNHSDAVLAYRAYCRQLRQSLSIPPSSEIEGLLRPLLVTHSRTPHRP
jgi:DNA-binding SARP family transcriptional activator